MVAGAPDKIVQPRALASQHDHAVPGQVELIVVRSAPLIETDDPQIFPLEFFKRAHQVHHARNTQVLGCASTCFDGHRAQRCRPPLRQHHAVHSGSVGNAQQRTQVLRVFHAIERQQQPSRAGFFRSRLEEVLDREKLLRVNHGHHALVRLGFGQKRQLLACLLADTHAGLTAQIHQPFQPIILPLAAHQYVVESPPSGLERLFYRMQPVQNFHER